LSCRCQGDNFFSVVLFSFALTSLDFTEARDSEWQWHQLGNMQVCNSLQTDNHASTPPLSFLQAGCPSWCPTNRVADLLISQLMPLPLTVSCFSKIQIGFAFLVPAHLSSPGKKGR